uniref:Uncharacterized protein n=1 Tax=Tetranychus urticae TaxID=32264 RepID=T1KE64_TETUR
MWRFRGYLSQITIFKDYLFSIAKFLTYGMRLRRTEIVVVQLCEAEVVAPGAVVGIKLGNLSIVKVFSKESDYKIPSTVQNLNRGESSVAIKFASQFDEVASFKEEQICPVSTVKSWNNVKGAGKVFTFNLADHSDEIKITAFRGECDKYFELVILRKVHIHSNAVAKDANKRWSDLEHVYELVVNSTSILKLDADNDSRCPQIKYNFVKILQLESV